MIGVFSKTTDSSFVEAAGIGGLDFIILDQEHGPVSQETLHDHVRAAEQSEMLSIVRVAENNGATIGGALDTGASGVQVPDISTAEEARAAVEAARFYPQGMRGVCRFVRAAKYGNKDKKEYFSESNSALVILQVEGAEGVENIDSILEVEGFDILFVGPYDLSQSLGCPGEVMHPRVQKSIRQIADKANKKEVRLGAFADSRETVQMLQKTKTEYIAYSVDSKIYLEAIRFIVENNK